MNALLSTAFDNSSPSVRSKIPQYEYDAFTNRRVRIPILRSKWVRELHDRFEELTRLQEGWDGYRGRAVSFHVASFAASLLERLCNEQVQAPSLVPGGDGSLQIEWHCFGYDIEFDIRAPLEIHCFRCELASGIEEEITLNSDFTELQAWIEDLAINRPE